MKGLRYVISVLQGAHICSSCEGVCTVQIPSQGTLQGAGSWSSVGFTQSATIYCIGMHGANAIEEQCVSAQARTTFCGRMSGTSIRQRSLHGANPSRSQHLYPVRGELGGGARPSDRPCLLLGFAPCKPFLKTRVRRRQRSGQGGFNLPGCLRQNKQWQEEFRNGK